MKLSIFTPTHDTKFLQDAYRSLCAQTDSEWEWVVIYNAGEKPVGFGDNRVKEYVSRSPAWVGMLKAEACYLATGDILLELDHDDMLMPSAVEEVKRAFADESVGFVYSNAIYATEKLEKVNRFDEAYGWRYKTATVDGHELDEHISFAPTPAAVSRIWYAPNHVRAFRRSAYEAAGGYNPEMRVLDDQDLMCRLYQQSAFRHIDRPLYVYRVHGGNTWMQPERNAEIQQNVYALYDKYIEGMALSWAKRSGFRALDLGGRIDAKPGYETVDRADADVVCDLNGLWPMPDSSVGVVRAFDVFEHLRAPLHTMRELYRVLAPGGMAFIQVPSTDGRGAFQDPTHVSFWNENSFWYYTRETHARYIGTPVRFQSTRLHTGEKNADQVCWTTAHLVSLKDDHRPPGIIEV